MSGIPLAHTNPSSNADRWKMICSGILLDVVSANSKGVGGERESKIRDSSEDPHVVRRELQPSISKNEES